MSKNGKVISIINMKGGVGKTALSVGISSFVRKKDEKVLIDSDPQFNATQAFIDPEDYLKSEKPFLSYLSPRQNYISLCNAKREELVTKINKNLDILMGDLNLVLVNKSSDSGLIKRLKRFITKIT